MKEKDIKKQFKALNWTVFVIGIVFIVFSNINNLDMIQGMLLGVGLFFFIYGMMNLIKHQKDNKK